MRKRILALLSVILLVCALVVPVSAASFNSEVRQSIAPIAVYINLDDAEGIFSYGTCFFIGDGKNNPQHLVTNYHVVDTYLQMGAGEKVVLSDDAGSYLVKASMRIYFNSTDYAEAYVIASDEQADIAVLRLEQPTDKRTALCLRTPTDDMIGSTAYAVGYPGISDNEISDPVSQWSPEDATVTTGSISRLYTSSGTGVKRVQLDADIRHGNSGGPLVDAEGNVVGINTGSVSNTNTGEEINYAVNVEELVALCDANAIPYTPWEDGSNLVLYIGIGAAVVLVIVVVLVLLRKKRRAAAGQPVTAAVSPTVPVPGPVAPTVGVENELRFQCTSGAFAGKRFSIDGTVRIGRDPARNDLVYPNNTQGVSGVHCILIMKDGILYLQDLGSTYGTFINGGQRLAANQSVALRIGDRFSLGSARESFVITPRGGL